MALFGESPSASRRARDKTLPLLDTGMRRWPCPVTIPTASFLWRLNRYDQCLVRGPSWPELAMTIFLSLPVRSGLVGRVLNRAWGPARIFGRQRIETTITREFREIGLFTTRERRIRCRRETGRQAPRLAI